MGLHSRWINRGQPPKPVRQKPVGEGDGPNVIEETRQYIRDFDRLVDKTSTTLELYNAMLSLYPDRLNRGALWGSARAIKG
jgi:hypothetical protein